MSAPPVTPACPSHNMFALPLTCLPFHGVCMQHLQTAPPTPPPPHPNHMLLSLLNIERDFFPFWGGGWFCSDITGMVDWVSSTRLLTYWHFSHCSQRLGPSRKTRNQGARKGRRKSRGRRWRNRSRWPCLASGAMRRWTRIWMTWRKTCGWSRS